MFTEAQHYRKLDNNDVICDLCPRDCSIKPGALGACSVRKNVDGQLIALTYGFPCTLAVDPIEKKPLYHFLPGQSIFSLATVGCNLFCQWCQNSSISHPCEPQKSKPYGYMSPDYIIELCVKAKCSLIAFTYTEPTVFFEYAKDIAIKAKERGIRTVMVSNGYIRKEPLSQILPFIDAFNIDMKMFDGTKHVKWTSAQLAPILDTIKTIAQSPAHLELTTLIVPEVNDSQAELENMFSWIERTLGKDAIVHISRFFPHHKATDKPPTPLETLTQAFRIAQKHINYAYVGNIQAQSATHNTVCLDCAQTIIERTSKKVNIKCAQGVCSCGKKIPGVWV